MYTEKDNKTVNILGTTYVILFEPVETSERLIACNADGITDGSVKQIIVGILEPKEDSQRNLDSCQRKVLRHEIIHAFLYESGLAESSNSCDAWAYNEEMVDWMATQFPKLCIAFEEAGAI